MPVVKNNTVRRPSATRTNPPCLAANPLATVQKVVKALDYKLGVELA